MCAHVVSRVTDRSPPPTGTRSRWNKPDILHFIGHGLVNWIDTRSGRMGSMPMLLTTTDHKHTKQPDFYDPDGVLKCAGGGGGCVLHLSATSRATSS